MVLFFAFENAWFMRHRRLNILENREQNITNDTIGARKLI